MNGEKPPGFTLAITPEDRMKWEHRRQHLRQKHPNPVRTMMASMASGAQLITKQGMNSQMHAAYQVSMEQDTRSSQVTQRKSTQGATIKDTVDFFDRDDRAEVEPDMEF